MSTSPAPTTKRRSPKDFYRQVRARKQDPLREPMLAIGVSVTVLVLLAVAFYVSATSGPHAKLPGVALGSKILLDLIRASIATAAVGLFLVIVIRGIFGYFPRELGTSSIKYEAEEVVEEETELSIALEALNEIVLRMQSDVEQLQVRVGLISPEVAAAATNPPVEESPTDDEQPLDESVEQP